MKMYPSNSENEKLFAKSVPVSFKNACTKQTKNLFLTMEWHDSSTGMTSRKVLVITLTNNSDPFFLYNLHLSEEDFKVLKDNQQLLISFAEFPQHIIEYIEKCLFEEKSSEPKFLLVFTVSGSVASPSQFDIIETNQFKQLVYLSLKFVAATEYTVRQYIATCFRNLKEENSQLQNNLASSEKDRKKILASKQLDLNSKERELESLREKSYTELSLKDENHGRELQQERSRLLDRLKEEQSKFEKEIKEKERRFRKEIQQLESRVNILDTLNKDMEEKNYKHESTIRDLRSENRSLEDEIKRLKDNIQNLRQKYDDLLSESKDKQSRIMHQEEIIKDLQQELRCKSQSISKLNEHIDFEAREKRSLEMELENAKLQYDMSEKARKILEKDKDELNEIILNLQDQVKKSKLKIDVAVRYKQTVEEKEKILENMKKESAELNYQLEVKNSEIKSLKESVNNHQEKIDKLTKELNMKTSTFKWMHRQLTENGIYPQFVPQSSNHNTSPSAIAQRQLAKISSPAGMISPDNSPSAVPSKKVTSKSVRKKLKEPCPASGDFARKSFRC